MFFVEATSTSPEAFSTALYSLVQAGPVVMAVIMFESAAFKQTWLFSDAFSELNASCNFA